MEPVYAEVRVCDVFSSPFSGMPYEVPQSCVKEIYLEFVKMSSLSLSNPKDFQRSPVSQLVNFVLEYQPKE